VRAARSFANEADGDLDICKKDAAFAEAGILSNVVLEVQAWHQVPARPSR
jgi:hypothetical protein